MDKVEFRSKADAIKIMKKRWDVTIIFSTALRTTLYLTRIVYVKDAVGSR